jgi:hypothetical protein
MAQVTIEYMILVPVLIIQIFIFPYTATVVMDSWANSRRTVELQQVASNLGSAIQQLYYTINHASIANGTMKVTLGIPQTIENYAYTATLSHLPSDASYKIMNVTLRLGTTKVVASTLVTLGDNVDWTDNLSFSSMIEQLTLTAAKTSNTVWLTCGGS